MPDLTVNGDIDLVKLMEALIVRARDFVDTEYDEDMDGNSCGYAHFDEQAFRSAFHECAVKAFTTRVTSGNGVLSQAEIAAAVYAGLQHHHSRIR